MKLTVYHDGQFWVGVVEVFVDGKLKADRHVFGVKPKDSEILDFINHDILQLSDCLVQGLTIHVLDPIKINPKRLARQVSREIQKKGISTQAQTAIQLEYEHRKKSVT